MNILWARPCPEPPAALPVIVVTQTAPGGVLPVLAESSWVAGDCLVTLPCKRVSAINRVLHLADKSLLGEMRAHCFRGVQSL